MIMGRSKYDLSDGIEAALSQTPRAYIYFRTGDPSTSIK